MSDATRRKQIKDRALELKLQVTGGSICDCEAMALLSEYIASLLTNESNKKQKFIEDFALVCGGRTGKSGSRDRTYFVAFGESCFKDQYQDGSNQVRHFAGFVLAAFYGGITLSNFALIFNELTGVYSWADMLLGWMAIRLGNGVDRAWFGIDIDDVGDWIRDHLCK